MTVQDLQTKLFELDIPHYYYNICGSGGDDVQKEIEIQSPADQHGWDQTALRKYRCKDRPIHQFGDSLRSRQRKHIHRNVDRCL